MHAIGTAGGELALYNLSTQYLQPRQRRKLDSTFVPQRLVDAAVAAEGIYLLVENQAHQAGLLLLPAELP